MNLNKWFNSSYFLQNLKKSRMTIALFFILVPVFTSLLVIAADHYAFDFATLGWINIVGMYIIPFIFSVSLFGFVFKKTSVDFMESMPISRKCIFITNTVGGIALIFCMQLLTCILTLAISYLSNGIIFTSMVWDIFVYQTIAYIFVFEIANLAMTLSGNLITQIAVTMLIAFLVPFSIWYVNIMASNDTRADYQLMNDEVELVQVSKMENYTAPFLIFEDGNYQYNTVSMWKMVILSIVYFGVGYFIFQKKKMENAGESFEKKYIHFIVKGLTLTPFVAFLKGIEGDASMTASLIVVTIMIVYYIIFDLMTSKRIKLWENLLIALLSITVIYGAYSMAIAINEKIDKKVDYKKINEIKINIDNSFYTKITQKDEIQKFLLALSRSANGYSYDDKGKCYTTIVLCQNNGSQYKKESYFYSKELREVIDESQQNRFLESKVVIANEQIKLTAEEQEKILQIINDSLQHTTMQEILEHKRKENNLNVILNTYQDHQLIRVLYPVTLQQDIQELMINAYNRYAIDYIQHGYYRGYYTADFYGRMDDETTEKTWFALNRGDSARISEFILAHAKDTSVDFSKCIKISSYYFSFYTDKIEEFMKVVNEICEENREEYENYKEEFSDEDIYDEEEGGFIERKEAVESIPVMVSGDID